MLPILETKEQFSVMTWLLFLLVGIGVVTIIGVLVMTFRNARQIAKLNKYVFGLLQSLDDKNYRLWRAKLKAEEELKKMKRKSAKLKP